MASQRGAGTLQDWISLLRSEDSAERTTACEALAAMGSAAIPALSSVLENHADSHAPWEVANGRKKIKDPEGAPSLVTALNDETIGLRWPASEALIRLGDPAMVATLRGLLSHSGSPNFRESAERVLRHISGHTQHEDVLRQVLAALEGVAAAETTP